MARSSSASLDCAGAKGSIVLRKPSGAITSGATAVLLETLQAGLKGQLVYRYPDEKSRVFYKWTEDWSAALKSFQSAKKDIQAAIDLWALGHSTASVFQFMRVLECGLRALAHNVGRTFETQQWQNIIDEINSSIEAERKTLPRGKE